MSKWNSKNRKKYLLQYHFILVCKYRKKLFLYKNISEDIKQLSYEICSKHCIKIKYMETDKDHIHYMIECLPSCSLSWVVNILKSYTTYHIWRLNSKILRKEFWRENTFWADGYFICSVGNVSEQTLKNYIENQG